MVWRELFFLVLLATPILPRRGGGSSGRGNSGSRTGVSGGGAPPSGGFNQPNRGGFQPSGGGFQPQPQPQPNWNQGGVRPNPGFSGQRPNTFNAGGGSQWRNQGVGSRSSSSNFKSALIGGAIGAASGLILYQAGKAIIQSATTPFNYGNRNYYFGENNYKGQKGSIMCSMPLEELQKVTATAQTTVAPTVTDGNSTTAPSTDQILNNLQFSDGSRPKTVTWSCKQGAEICCGTECCPAPAPSSSGTGGGSNIGTIVLLVVIFLLCLCCCGCFIVYKCFRSVLPFGRSSSSSRADKYEQQGVQQYPMETYPQDQSYPPPQSNYVPQQGYPPQPGYPVQQGYPPQPYHNYNASYPTH